MRNSDYSFFKIISYLYTIDEDGEHYEFNRYIGKMMLPGLYDISEFLGWALYVVTPIVLVICNVKWWIILLSVFGCNLVSLICTLLVVLYYRKIKYRFLSLESLYEEREKITDIRRELNQRGYYGGYENGTKRERDYYQEMYDLCSYYIRILEDKKEKQEKLLEEKAKKDNMTEEDKIIYKYMDEFNDFINYMRNNVNVLSEYDYDFDSTINELEDNGNKLLDLVINNHDSYVLLNKTFSIYINEVKEILTNIKNIEDLRTEANIKKFTEVLENFNTYFINLRDKVINFKEVNLNISMNTILKEFDVDNYTGKDDGEDDENA